MATRIPANIVGGAIFGKGAYAIADEAVADEFSLFDFFQWDAQLIERKIPYGQAVFIEFSLHAQCAKKYPQQQNEKQKKPKSSIGHGFVAERNAFKNLQPDAVNGNEKESNESCPQPPCLAAKSLYFVKKYGRMHATKLKRKMKHHEK